MLYIKVQLGIFNQFYVWVNTHATIFIYARALTVAIYVPIFLMGLLSFRISVLWLQTFISKFFFSIYYYSVKRGFIRLYCLSLDLFVITFFEPMCKSVVMSWHISGRWWWWWWWNNKENLEKDAMLKKGQKHVSLQAVPHKIILFLLAKKISDKKQQQHSFNFTRHVDVCVCVHYSPMIT